jgi:YD repeat-containing protein
MRASNAAGAAATNVPPTRSIEFNQVLTKTDPEGNVTTYTYDPANGNLLTTTTDPLTAVVRTSSPTATDAHHTWRYRAEGPVDHRPRSVATTDAL